MISCFFWYRFISLVASCSRVFGHAQFDLSVPRLRVSQLGVVRHSLSRPRPSYRFYHRVPTSFRPLEAVFFASRGVRGWLLVRLRRWIRSLSWFLRVIRMLNFDSRCITLYNFDSRCIKFFRASFVSFYSTIHSLFLFLSTALLFSWRRFSLTPRWSPMLARRRLILNWRPTCRPAWPFSLLPLFPSIKRTNTTTTIASPCGSLPRLFGPPLSLFSTAF